jgi:hypothetical protein
VRRWRSPAVSCPPGATTVPGVKIGLARRRPPRPILVGRTAEPIAGTDPDGRPARRDWPSARRELIAFLTGGCTTCQTFWSGFADPRDGDLPAVVVTPDPATESRRAIASRVTGGLQVIMSTAAWMSYGVRGAPWFVVVDDGLVVAEGTAGSWAELRALTG